MTTFYLTLDAAGVVTGAGMADAAADGATVVDASTYAAASGRIGLCKLVDGALEDYAPPPSPAAPRVARLSDLLDPLSPAQRAMITVDHMGRLQAEVFDHPGGLPIGNIKLCRAAGDLGMTPDAWFTLAGA